MKYNDLFWVGTCDVSNRARQYMEGLLLNRGRGNCSRFARTVRKSTSQSLQNFITDSPWDEREVVKRLQRDVAELIGDPVEGSIHIDETGFPKQGNHSVGVQRQYCGRLGKVDNCQVGVFLGYVNGSRRTLIDGQLYLPKDWAHNNNLRAKCKVPKDVRFRTKAEIGLDMVLNARKNGVPFGWVGMDCFYGEQSHLRNKLDEEGLVYIADIPRDTRVWITMPQIGVPERNGDRGRIPSRKRVLDGDPPIEVQKLKDQIQDWSVVTIRDTERKVLQIEIAALRVHPVEDKLPGKEQWLIIRKETGNSTFKYQLSNSSPHTQIERLAKMSCSRYWIERAFEDAKGVASLADYETRSWRSWHHHVAMVLLAMLALLMMQIELGSKADLLTVQDIKEILEVILPKRIIDDQLLLEIIKAKHKARFSARESHHRRSNASPYNSSRR